MSDALDYLRALYGDHTGRAHIGIGAGPYRDDGGKYAHREWLPGHYAWPDEAERLAERIARESAAGRDVYCCVNLMHGAKRAQGAAAARAVIHADVDGPLDLAEVERLGGFAVGSGTGGHGHAYIPLAEDIPENVRRALCVGLRERLGGDHKIAENDVLRPPGTLNYKPTTRGEPPAPVVWLLRPSGARQAPQVLADALGVSLDAPMPHSAAQRPEAPRTVERFDLARLPSWVAEKVAEVSGDRSADTQRIVGGCHDAGLSLAQTRFVVESRADLAERLAGRTDDDVARCWERAQRNAAHPGRAQSAAQDAQNGPHDAGEAAAGIPAAEGSESAQEAAGDVLAELVAQELRKLIVRERARALYAERQRPAGEPFDADTLAGLLARPAEPRARIDGLLPWQAAALIVAQRKTGKTTMVANLARSLVTGEDFLDRFAVRPVTGCVGVLNYEVSGAQFARWAADAGVPADRLFVVNLRGRRNPLAHPEDRERLAGLLRSHEVETLMVDPFGRAYSGQSQNDAGEVGAWLTDLDLFARSEVGALDVILTAHAGWNGERSRGSTALEDWADAVWTMTRDEEDDARYLRAIGRDVDLDEDRLAYDATTRRLTLSGAGGRRQAAQGRKIAELVEWVVKAVTGHPGGLGVEDLRKAIKAMPGAPSFRRDEVPKAAERARDEGRIHIVGGRAGQRKLHYPAVIPNPSQPVPTRPGDDRKPVPSPIWGTGTGGTGTGEAIGDGLGTPSTPCPRCGGPLEAMRAAAGLDCLDCYQRGAA